MRDEGVAREVVQESFARLLERWGRVRAYERPGAWLRTVTVRQALRRREGRRRETSWPRSGSRSRPPEAPAADHGVAARMDVLDAIAELPDRQRAVIVLHYLHDLTTDEIANDLGSRPGTVRAQLHQARARLATLLDQEIHDVAR